MVKKELMIKLKKIEVEELLEREITKFGSGSHTILPRKHIGKKAVIVIESK